MSIYDTLNKEQKEACYHTQGPVLILAGAGSGKTRVITHRIAYLMDECGVDPWNILAITFTNKAAGEMRERVDSLIGADAQGVWISTFHSMCVRILRRYSDSIGISSDFTIYDASDQKTLIRHIFSRLSIDSKRISQRAVLSAISGAKNELKSAKDYAESAKESDIFEQVVARVYEEYEQELRKNNALDFDDLLMKTVTLFLENEGALEVYQKRFRYIMVDEYQDTNHAQFEIVRLLSQQSKNLCVVGDDDQSIYKFRGADIRNILDFEKFFPNAFVVFLEQNYRSTQNVLDAANAVISHNHDRKDKNLWTDKGEGEKIHLKIHATAKEEADYVASDIERRVKIQRKYSYKDIAILYRTNAQSRLLEDYLVRRSIPYDIVGGHNFYDRMEVRDLLGYLKTIDNEQDDVSLERIINVPRRGIGEVMLGRIRDLAHEKERSVFEVLLHLYKYPELSRSRKKLTPFVDLILDFREYAKDHTLAELIEKIVTDIGYEEYLKEYDEDSAEDRMENVGELISKAASFDAMLEESSEQEEGASRLSLFLQDVSLVADIDQVADSDNRVLLMTIHSAKGLEFPLVYMTGMEENLFPSSRAIEDVTDPNALEEERRLAYVGITRAKEELCLNAAMSRYLFGQVQIQCISRFVEEIPNSLLDNGPSDVYEEDLYAGQNSQSGAYQNPYKKNYRNIRSQGAGDMQQEEKKTLPKGFAKPARPRAIYTPPRTDETVRPYLSGTSGLDSLKKGLVKSHKPDYEIGDRVIHVKYGCGTVEKIEETPKDYKVTVLFDEAGQKIMYAAFAKLVKTD